MHQGPFNGLIAEVALPIAVAAVAIYYAVRFLRTRRSRRGSNDR